MRVGRKSLAVNLLPEFFDLFVGEPTHQVGAGIDTGDRVSLEEDEIAAGRVIHAAPEPVEADIVERSRRGVGSDVAADIGVAVGAHDHGHGVPAQVVADADFDGRVARILGLEIGGNGVDVLSGRAIGQVNALLASLGDQAFDQEVGALGAFLLNDSGERFLPFTGFLRIGIFDRRSLGQVGCCGHVLSPGLRWGWLPSQGNTEMFVVPATPRETSSG